MLLNQVDYIQNIISKIIQSDTAYSLIIIQMIKKEIAYLLLFSIIEIIESASVVPAFQITSKYIETSTYTLNTLGYFYGNTSWIGADQTTFNVVFNNTHPTGSRYQLTLQELDFQFTPALQVNITVMKCGFGNSYFVACLDSTKMNYIKTLRLRYLVLAVPFNKFALYTAFLRATGVILNSVTPYIGGLGVPAFNISGTMRVFLAFQGLNVTAPNSDKKLDLKVSGSFSASNVISVKIETTIVENIGFQGATFALIAYNQELAASWPFPAVSIEFISFSGAGSNAIYTDTPGTTRTYNTFWGLTRFNINNNNFFHFTSDYTQPTGIIGTSLYPFNNLEFTVMIFKFKQCDTPVPYYLSTNTTCYDLCPARYYEENTQLVCNLCVPYDCYKCLANGTCTLCSNSTDFRVINSAGRCVAMEGYYDDGTNNPQAKPCDPNCKSCITSAIQCTSCFSGFFVNSSTKCEPCSTNCQICTSATVCTKCISLYELDASNACVSSINCSLITNCINCNITNGCMQCSIGYNLTNLTSCSAVCGDGIKLSFENCDDNNTNSTDGCDNCAIPNGYYCNNTNFSRSSCDVCKLHCTSCNSSTDCFSCQTPYLLQNITQNCVPDCSLLSNCVTCHEPIGSNQTICDSCTSGYEIINQTCQPKCGDGILISPEECDDNNKAANDGCNSFCIFENNSICDVINNRSNCSFCPLKTYANSNHTQCVQCINYDCRTCDSTGICLSCGIDSNRILDNTTNRCIPKDGFYDDGASYVAATCSNDCKTCSVSNSSCQSCFSNRILTNNSCVTCGSILGVGCSSCSFSNSSYVCLACSGLIINNTCKPSIALPEVQDKLAKMLLMILLPILLALCCCCLIIFCIWRRRKNQQNKIEQDGVKDKQPALNETINPVISMRRPKGYKPQNKRLQPKIQRTQTQGNELSMDQFKDLKDVKIDVVKQRSELGDRFDRSMQSEKTESVEQDDDGNSKGGAY